MIHKIITGDLGVNTYLYNYKNKKVVIVDPGDFSQEIRDMVEIKALEPTAIVLTHGHFDHIGAVNDLREYYNIPIFIHVDDSTFLGKAGELRQREMFSSMGPSGDYYFKTYYKYIKEADVLLNHGDIIPETDLKVIHTPGHSPGSICLYSPQNTILFSGDTLFKGGLGRTDFPGGDFDTIIKSLTLLQTLPKGTVVYPGHGEETTIEKEFN